MREVCETLSTLLRLKRARSDFMLVSTSFSRLLRHSYSLIIPPYHKIFSRPGIKRLRCGLSMTYESLIHISILLINAFLQFHNALESERLRGSAKFGVEWVTTTTRILNYSAICLISHWKLEEIYFISATLNARSCITAARMYVNADFRAWLRAIPNSALQDQ